MKQSAYLASATAIALLLGNSMSVAVEGYVDTHDRKMIYQGSNCSSSWDGIHYSHSRAHNLSGNNRIFIECPIPVPPDGVKRVKVQVVDQSYNDNVSCTLGRFNNWAPSAFHYAFTQSARSGWMSSIAQTLTFSGFQRSSLGWSNHADYAYSLGCWVPATFGGKDSRINGYTVWEYD